MLTAACAQPSAAPAPEAARGRAGVVTTRGRPVAGAFVTLRGGAVATTVITDAAGAFALPAPADGGDTLEVRRTGFAPLRVAPFAAGGARPALELEPAETRVSDVASNAFLGELPDGAEKRRFILDCTGCHVFDAAIARTGGLARTEFDWRSAIRMMLSFAGANTGFPIISASHDADATAAWLAEHLGDGVPPQPASTARAARGAVITEWELPDAGDLPHDLALDSAGGVVITGMLRGVMYRLDPATGAFERVPIPVPQANPRAVEVDADGAWWVLLGGPHRVARYEPASRRWESHAIGVYAHDVVLDPAGRVWFNGHFTKDPERIGYLDVASGAVEHIDVPIDAMPDGGSNIPYGFTRAPDGALWGTQLLGNRLLRHDPATGAFRFWTLPVEHAGPRRLDVAPDGTVWVPLYAANALARFDLASERFTLHPYPTPDALPYIARVDDRTGQVWVATAAANAIARFDPATGEFTEVRLPVQAGLVRHIVVDDAGAVWGAYAPFPPRSPRVFRVSLPAD